MPSEALKIPLESDILPVLLAVSDPIYEPLIKSIRPAVVNPQSLTSAGFVATGIIKKIIG